MPKKAAGTIGGLNREVIAFTWVIDWIHWPGRLAAERRRLRINMGDAHLFKQRQIIFDMPVVRDPAVFELHKIRGDEVDSWPVPFVRPNLPVKWPVNFMCTVT
jgi:hypothetical protein